MAGGGQKSGAVAGGMNLSTPTMSGPYGMQMLGMPQTSKLSPMQNLWGNFGGNQNYQMFQPTWMQALNQMGQQNRQPQQGTQSGGNLGSAASGIGNMIGLLSLL